MVWAPESSAAPGPGTGTTLQVLRALASGPRGLTEAEAEERIGRYGENTLPGRRPASWPHRFARSLRDPFTAVLLGLGVVSALLASWGTALVICVLVTVSCVLRATGEHRADRSAAALRELVASTATVRRRATDTSAPEVRELPVDQLVPGDVVLLAPGDLVPADLHLLRARGLTVHEAALTGESAPIAKTARTASQDPAATGLDLPHQCFQGSSVVSGTGTGVVVATGRRTLLSGALSGAPRRRPPGPFDRSVNGIAWTLVRFMLLVAPLALVAGALVRGRGLETLPFAVAVAVGLTPEMLPVIVTASLARGAALLARGGEVVVRRLPALHDLGAADVLCVDKTGTLTENRPVLALAENAAGHPDDDVLRWAALGALWTLHLAELPVPDALDDAVLDACPGDLDDLPYEGVDALPCGPGRRLATAVVRRPGDPRFALAGTHTLVVKGAPEDVLDRCALDAADRERHRQRAAGLAAEGLRVLAVARAERPARERPYTEADEHDLTFTGFLALRDAPAPGAAEALAALARHGVTVKVLTGDHPGTAVRVCHELGLAPGDAVTGDRIDALDDAALMRLAATTTVFARCTPAHKARVVTALRGAGHTTGFLGDGVNDLAALHAADVGVCPRDGVDVAREAADVVLAAKDLTALDRAIVTGRRSTANIGSYLRITLSSNIGNVIAMLAAGLMLPFLPMLPAQVLVQNLFFDTAQLALAFDRPGPAAAATPAVLRPRALLRFVTGFGLLNAAADVATFAVLAAGDEGVFHAGWFTENLLTQAMVMVLLRTGRLPGPLRAAVAGLALAGLLLPASPAGAALGMAPLPVPYYGALGAVLAVYGCALAVARRR
ncbi:magnesium-translocating P-type ATPase [Streptomyces sp. NPDC049585]|uniref:magnesium-translocating P-type ATPase n=1 Tax=Streptomyces sp. NPDC049585 TaxID=3155154 RepID=UPI0034443140